MFDWRVLPAAVRRIDLGGKALTNFMKELVSYRWGAAGTGSGLPGGLGGAPEQAPWVQGRRSGV